MWAVKMRPFEGEMQPKLLNVILARNELSIEIPVVLGAPLARVFASGVKSLIPMIFSHGLMGKSLGYSVLLREMASYGMVVVGVDHLDGSCGFTVN
jgi:hypothetical protein